MPRLFFRLLAVLPILPAAHAAEPNQFEHRVEIMPGEEVSGPALFRIPPEMRGPILSEADMRLFDATGREIPFVLKQWFRSPREVSERVPLLNRQLDEADGSQSFEFELPDLERPIDRLRLIIMDENYRREVSLYGKEKEHDDYQLIVEGKHVVRLTSNEDDIAFIHDTIVFPPQRVPFYKVRLRGNEPDFELATEFIQYWKREERLAERETVPLKLEKLEGEQLAAVFRESPDLEERYGSSTFYLVELPHARMPVDRMYFEIDVVDFARRMKLFRIKPDSLEVGRQLAATSLFRFGEDEQLQVKLTPVRALRYLVQLIHADDEPVEISSVTGALVRWDVQFLADEKYQRPLWFYFGTVNGKMPRYDLAQNFQRNKVDQFSEVSLGVLERNEGYVPQKKKPKSEEIPYLIYLIVGVLIVILAFYMRSLTQEIEEDQSADQ